MVQRVTGKNQRAKQVTVAGRRERVAELAAMRMSERDIAAQLSKEGIKTSPMTVSRDLEVLARRYSLTNPNPELTNGLKMRQTALLNTLIQANISNALNPPEDNSGQPNTYVQAAATTNIMRALEREARLHGLDAKDQIDMQATIYNAQTYRIFMQVVMEALNDVNPELRQTVQSNYHARLLALAPQGGAGEPDRSAGSDEYPVGG